MSLINHLNLEHVQKSSQRRLLGRIVNALLLSTVKETHHMTWTWQAMQMEAWLYYVCRLGNPLYAVCWCLALFGDNSRHDWYRFVHQVLHYGTICCWVTHTSRTVTCVGIVTQRNVLKPQVLRLLYMRSHTWSFLLSNFMPSKLLTHTHMDHVHNHSYVFSCTLFQDGKRVPHCCVNVVLIFWPDASSIWSRTVSIGYIRILSLLRITIYVL